MRLRLTTVVFLSVDDEEAVIRGWLRRRARVTRWQHREPHVVPAPLTDPASVLALVTMWLPVGRRRPLPPRKGL